MKLYVMNSIRTNNFNDEHMIDNIKTMWEEAYRQLEKYPNSVYGIYYDYESDYKGDYSLGVAIEEPRGELSIELPDNGKYEVFQVDSSDEMGVIKAWQKIWEQEEAGALKRAYSYDFEKYSPNGNIEIYIAIL